jgi:hypothetical protein
MVQHESCPYCDYEGNGLTCHWRYCEKGPPELTDRQREIIIGCMMGDGARQSSTNESQQSVGFTYSCAEERFRDWLYEELTPFASSKGCYPEERIAGGQSDQYRVQTRAMPCFEFLNNWYEAGNQMKSFTDVDFTPLKVKLWFCGDGTFPERLDGRRSIPKIGHVPPESESIGVLIDKFEGVGIEAKYTHPSFRFNLTNGAKDAFFEYIGDPLPGYEYKWPDNF